MSPYIIFVYSKKNKIKVVTLEEAKVLNLTLHSKGWRHTKTLDACQWIENLYNHFDKEGIDRITSLSKKKC